MVKDCAKVTDSWHITIPKHIRELMQLEKGDSIEFVWQDKLIFIQRKSKGEDE